MRFETQVSVGLQLAWIVSAPSASRQSYNPPQAAHHYLHCFLFLVLCSVDNHQVNLRLKKTAM